MSVSGLVGYQLKFPIDFFFESIQDDFDIYDYVPFAALRDLSFELAAWHSCGDDEKLEDSLALANVEIALNIDNLKLFLLHTNFLAVSKLQGISLTSYLSVCRLISKNSCAGCRGNTHTFLPSLASPLKTSHSRIILSIHTPSINFLWR